MVITMEFEIEMMEGHTEYTPGEIKNLLERDFVSGEGGQKLYSLGDWNDYQVTKVAVVTEHGVKE